MLNFSLVRVYFYWLAFYTDASGTFSSAGVGWLCAAGLKLGKEPGWGVWETSHTRNPTATQTWVCCRFRGNTYSDEIPCLGWKGLYFFAITAWLCVKNRYILDEDKYQKAEYLTPIFCKTFWLRSFKLAFWSHDTNYCRAQQNGAGLTIYAVRNESRKKSVNDFCWRKEGLPDGHSLYLYPFYAA